MEILVSIDILVVVAIAKAIVRIVMVEFCGGLWLHPLSQDLFSTRVSPKPLKLQAHLKC